MIVCFGYDDLNHSWRWLYGSIWLVAQVGVKR